MVQSNGSNCSVTILALILQYPDVPECPNDKNGTISNGNNNNFSLYGNNPNQRPSEPKLCGLEKDSIRRTENYLQHST